jgi:hypothetical protein
MLPEKLFSEAFWHYKVLKTNSALHYKNSFPMAWTLNFGTEENRKSLRR